MSAKRKAAGVSFLCAVSALILMTFLFPDTARAEDDNSISLVCRQDSEAVEHMHWTIYKVGERKDGDFRLTGAYKDYPINLRDMSADNIAGAAKAMEGFIIASNVPSLAESYTDAKGTVSFPGLDTGLYFATAGSVEKGVFLRRADPIFFEVTDTGYESTIFPKVYSIATLSDEITNFTVKKVWVDSDNNYQSRPVNVTVDIYKNGALAETVILDDKNNWTYSWLSDEHTAEWRVVERYIPRKYEVYVDYNFTQYLIKNTYVPELITDGDDYVITTARPMTPVSTVTSSVTSVTTTSVTTSETYVEGSTISSMPISTTVGGGTDTASETTTGVSSTVGGGTATASSTTTAPTDSVEKSKLPQTGQLWWPIPFQLGGGFLMLTASAVIDKKNKKK